MINFGEALGIDGQSNLPGEAGEPLDVRQCQWLAMVFDEEEPIPTPGDVAFDLTKTRHIDAEALFLAPTGNIVEGHLAVFVERSGDDPNGRLDPVRPGPDAPQVGEGGQQTDGSMAAHAQVADVVEKDDPRDARGVLGFDQDGADDHNRAARFLDDRRADMVVSLAEFFQLVGGASFAKRGTASDHDPGGFAACVGINNGKAWRHGLGSAASGALFNNRPGNFGRVAMPS